MDPGLAAILCIVSMIFLLTIGVPIAFALGFSAAVCGTLAFGPMALYKMGLATFSLFYNYSWTPLPLFVLMACIITETAIGKDLYNVARNWVSHLPGALVSASILGEALMASTVGVSGAAIVAVGKVAEPELNRYGYDRKLALGGLMCGGVLGPLIPPSTPLIIYGVIANVSIGHLLIAGIIPGALLALMLAAVPVLICWRNPQLGPAAGSTGWATRWASLSKIWPIIAVLMAIIGSIFFGIATPTEAAGIGCVVMIVIAVTVFHLRWKGLYRAMAEAAVINAMMLVVIVAASFFSYMLASAGVGELLNNLVASLNIPPRAVVAAIMILYLILGSLFDSITITMLTVPIFAPLLAGLGLDLVWFGILYVVNLEIGLITPPMGVNLCLVRNVFNVKSSDLLKGAVPFLITLIVFLIILLLVPDLSLWLPKMMSGF
jgi:tripartite ATP-independent transporter DctM subunit